MVVVTVLGKVCVCGHSATVQVVIFRFRVMVLVEESYDKMQVNMSVGQRLASRKAKKEWRGKRSLELSCRDCKAGVESISSGPGPPGGRRGGGGGGGKVA